ncbi:hypothetical protein CAPTEDRAFT_226910 [Capitella teleta]|uniref:Uncharacterized protein n=1 Tax=Capitella teleta TaxID=283909 RepID=R7V021_CAPTE|nr:hypothetical protein CAPTEDRAFT_221094 [Capitella teleta]ELU11872.1 hypothetical protein CAPTEDRAFT_226910 [Capitella teleta]|eukprot:ELT97052.1 hypothetical protein CAPTEDRAFT_221094 [Capitella teleta]
MRVRLNPACDELGMVVDRPSRKQQKKAPKSQSKASEVVIEHAFVHEPPSISQPGSSENTAPSKQSADLLETVAEFIDIMQNKPRMPQDGRRGNWDPKRLGRKIVLQFRPQCCLRTPPQILLRNVFSVIIQLVCGAKAAKLICAHTTTHSYIAGSISPRAIKNCHKKRKLCFEAVEQMKYIAILACELLSHFKCVCEETHCLWCKSCEVHLCSHAAACI